MAVDPDPMLPRSYRVDRIIEETDDTFTLHLEPFDGHNGQPYAAGQFNMLYVYGVGEVPISISGSPVAPVPLVHTTRVVGAVTRAMRALKKGDLIGVRGPYGSHWPIEKAEGSDVVIVAGGIGLAPLRPALYQMMAQREKFGRIVLLYGTRTPDDILFRQELKQWRGEFDLEIYITVDRAMEGWRGNVGVVTTLIPRAPFDPHNTVALICGPEVMMKFTVQGLNKRGVTYDRIFVSMERNMKCGTGFCGHCQFGPTFVCKDGPVFAFSQIQNWFDKWEI